MLRSSSVASSAMVGLKIAPPGRAGASQPASARSAEILRPFGVPLSAVSIAEFPPAESKVNLLVRSRMVSAAVSGARLSLEAPLTTSMRSCLISSSVRIAAARRSELVCSHGTAPAMMSRSPVVPTNPIMASAASPKLSNFSSMEVVFIFRSCSPFLVSAKTVLRLCL